MLRCVMPLRARLAASRLPPMTPVRNQSSASEHQSDEIFFRTLGAVREVTLNRPTKLNALSQQMIKDYIPRLQEYNRSDAAGIILLKGAGKALCAGGDVFFLANETKNNGIEAGGKLGASYFRTEFGLNHYIATYPKPYVSFMHGVTMGGGIGLSAHGPFRIATETTMMAMPETKIGYYPDVGGLFFLTRLDGQFGLYMALTSDAVKGYDAYLNRLATHFVPSSQLEGLQQRLTELTPTQEMPATSKEYYKLVASAIEEYSVDPPSDYKPALTKEQRQLIDEAFAHDSVEDILAALEKDGSSFALKTKATILERCPTSVKVVVAAYRRIARLDLKSAFELERNLCDHFTHDPNFAEGVVALLKEKRKPNWKPASLGEVSSAYASKYLERFEGEDFGPIHYVQDGTYDEYPHDFALPTEADIQAFVTGKTSNQDTKVSRNDVLAHFSAISNKAGLDVRVDQVLARKARPDSTDPSLLDWVY